MSTNVPVQNGAATGERPSVKRRAALLGVSELLGRKWHPLILYNLLEEGSMGFSELKRGIDGISGKMLSESLEALEEEYGVVEREIVNTSPVRVEYSLTATGESLEPILVGMNDWGKSNLAPAESEL